MRTLDGTFLTQIANHDNVRPALGGTGEIDLVAAVADPRNFAFQNEEGGFFFTPVHPGAYEGHTIFAPRSHFKQVLALAAASFEYLFTQTDCDQILTKVPDNNKGAQFMGAKLGFMQDFHRDDAWASGVGVSYQKLTLDRWAVACSTAEEQGRMFHIMLERAKKDFGSILPDHPEDVIHDRAVGACIMMIRAGNVIKGVNYYNCWAIFAGYPQIGLLSEQPPLIDAGEGVIVGMTNGQMEVFRCL